MRQARENAGNRSIKSASSSFWSRSILSRRTFCGKPTAQKVGSWHHPEMERLQAIRDQVLAAIRPVPDEVLGLAAATGRWLAKDVRAAVPAPQQTCSAMDGWAVRSSDAAAPVEL